MIFVRTFAHAIVVVLPAGCSVMHGHVDFLAPPLFGIPLVEYSSIMFFRGSTVVRVHSGTSYNHPAANLRHHSSGGCDSSGDLVYSATTEPWTNELTKRAGGNAGIPVPFHVGRLRPAGPHYGR